MHGEMGIMLQRTQSGQKQGICQYAWRGFDLALHRNVAEMVVPVKSVPDEIFDISCPGKIKMHKPQAPHYGRHSLSLPCSFCTAFPYLP